MKSPSAAVPLRERIARALCKGYDRQEREDGRLGGALVAYNAGVGMTIAFWNGMADLALAAIEAAGMVVVPREATEGMVTAAINRPIDEAANDYSSVWTAMIDKAREG